MVWAKAQIFPIEIPEDVRTAMKFMDPKAKLAQLTMKLQLTPRRASIRYIAWAHQFLSTREPDPLPELLNRLEAGVQAQIGAFGTTRVCRTAERTTFVLVEVYALALSSWLEEIWTTLLLISTTLMSGACPLAHRPALLVRMRDQLERLSVHSAVVEIIQADDLRATVLPPAFRDRLEFARKECALAYDLLGGTKSDLAEVFEPTRLSTQAQKKVEILRSEASARASLESCHRSALLLAQAEMVMKARLKDWKFCRSVFEDSTGRELDHSRRSTPRAATAKRRTGKPQQSKRSRGAA